MKFLIDHNLPPVWAAALTLLSHSERPIVEVKALREKFSPDTKDIDWISTLGKEGGWYVLSSDRFTKGEAERAALRSSGLTVFRLDKAWAKQSYWPKTQALVKWWPRILEQSRLMEGGGIIEVPFSYGRNGRFRFPPVF